MIIKTDTEYFNLQLYQPLHKWKANKTSRVLKIVTLLHCFKLPLFANLNCGQLGRWLGVTQFFKSSCRSQQTFKLFCTFWAVRAVRLPHSQCKRRFGLHRFLKQKTMRRFCRKKECSLYRNKVPGNKAKKSISSWQNFRFFV